MEYIIGFLVRASEKNPIELIRYIIKSMRLVSVIIFSIHVYKWIWGDFSIITNIQDMYKYFIDLSFFKPLIALSISVIFFDVVLNYLIVNVFNSLLMSKKIKNVKNASNDIKSGRIVIKKEEVHEKLKNKKIFGFSFNINNSANYAQNLEKINTGRLDIFCLILTQWLIISVLYKISLIWCLAIIAAILLLEYIKRLIEFSKEVYGNFIQNIYLVNDGIEINKE